MDCELHHQLPEDPSITFRKPDSNDILHIVREMRPSDVRELTEHPYSGDRILAETVRDSVAVSEIVYAACHNGVPFLLFGCAYPSKWIGTPWLFGTVDMEKRHRQVYRASSAWLTLMQRDTGVLVNLFDTRNFTHVRWAKHMGFKPSDSVNINYQYMVRYRT